MGYTNPPGYTENLVKDYSTPEEPQLVVMFNEFEELLSKNDAVLRALDAAGHRLKNTSGPQQTATKEPGAPPANDCISKFGELLGRLRRQGGQLNEITDKIASLV